MAKHIVVIGAGDFDPGVPGVMIPRHEKTYICSIGVDQRRGERKIKIGLYASRPA